jgi:hypothetical protein
MLPGRLDRAGDHSQSIAPVFGAPVRRSSVEAPNARLCIHAQQTKTAPGHVGQRFGQLSLPRVVATTGWEVAARRANAPAHARERSST